MYMSYFELTERLDSRGAASLFTIRRGQSVTGTVAPSKSVPP
jgi:hypothetical protein